MKISTKSQYGLRAMLYLAKRKDICSVKDVALKEKIPFDYLSKIFLKLKKARLVRVKRGGQGGYFLALPAGKISIGKIIGVLDGDRKAAPCLGGGKSYACPHNRSCSAKGIWKKIQHSWESTLDSLTLAQAAE